MATITLNTELANKAAVEEILELLQQNNFSDARFKLLANVEGFVGTAEDDSRGLRTVGYGFNMEYSGAAAEFIGA
jgi:hypothetical protein